MAYKNHLLLPAVLTIAFAGVAAYGGISGSEVILGMGIAAAFVCLVLMPAFHLRAARLAKISRKESPLIRFEYTPNEINEIAAAQRKAVFKKSVWLSVLLSICFAVISAPFVIFSLPPEPSLPPMLPYAVPCVLLPWLSLIIAPCIVVKSIHTRPCVSLVGREYVLVANRYHGINDRYLLNADCIRFEHGKNGKMGSLNVQYSFKAMRYLPRTFTIWVQIPVPHDKEKDAAALRIHA